MAPVLTVLVIVACANYFMVSAQDSGSCKIGCIGQTCDTVIAQSALNNPTDCAALEKTYVWCRYAHLEWHTFKFHKSKPFVAKQNRFNCDCSGCECNNAIEGKANDM